MAITSAQVSVGTTAVALNTASGSWTRMRVAVASGGSAIYLGPAAVTTSNGCILAAGTFIDVELPPGDVLYGIIGASTQTTQVLRVSN